MQVKLRIEGVSCNECVNTIKRFIKVLPNVIDVQFTDGFEQAIVSTLGDVPYEWLQMAVKEAGYTLVESSP